MFVIFCSLFINPITIIVIRKFINRFCKNIILCYFTLCMCIYVCMCVYILCMSFNFTNNYILITFIIITIIIIFLGFSIFINFYNFSCWININTLEYYISKFKRIMLISRCSCKLLWDWLWVNDWFRLFRLYLELMWL